MKKYLLIAAVAVAAVSTPAMAQLSPVGPNWQGKTYGQDAIGHYQLNASVQSFCKFGTNNQGGAGTNGSTTAGAPGSTAEADGTFTLNIQNAGDNTIQAASAVYKINHAVCNSPFKMEIESANGGLKNATNVVDTDFTNLVKYNVNFVFDTQGGTVNNVNTGTTQVADVNHARAGNAGVTVSVAAADKLLLVGNYADFLKARLVPQI